MIAVNPPGNFLWDAKTTDEQIRRYAALCAQDETAAGGPTTSPPRCGGPPPTSPTACWFLPIKEGNVRVASFFGLMDSTSEAAPLSAPMTLDTWLSAANGDASGFWFQSLLADLAFPKRSSGASSPPPRCSTRRRRASTSLRRPAARLDPRRARPFIWGGGRLADAWPANAGRGRVQPRAHVERRDAPDRRRARLRDAAAGRDEGAPAVPAERPPGRAAGVRALDDFWADQPEAGSRLINTFLDSGQVDHSLYTPQKVDFTPEVTQTALAKGIAGTMVGLALLTVLSLLLWLAAGAQARPLRAQGQRGAAVAVPDRARPRRLVPRRPDRPHDDARRPARQRSCWPCSSVGVPIGLGIYLAWVHRDWSARSKAAGFARGGRGRARRRLAGFHATAGLLALVTAIVGAAVGANLTLILLDVARVQPRGRFTETTSRETLDARLSTG